MFNKHNLAVKDFAAKEPSYGRGLNDVRFTPKETIATNGHYMVRVSNPPSETIQTTTAEFSIPALSLKPIKVKDGDAVELATNGTGTTWNLTTGTNTYHLEQSAERFPNVDAIMPKEKPSVVIGFNAEYVAKIAKAFANFHDANVPTIKVSFYGPDKAAKFEATNLDGQTMTALLMPVRL